MGLFDRLMESLRSSQQHVKDLAHAERDAARVGNEGKAARYGRLRAAEEQRVSDLQREVDKRRGS